MADKMPAVDSADDDGFELAAPDDDGFQAEVVPSDDDGFELAAPDADGFQAEPAAPVAAAPAPVKEEPGFLSQAWEGIKGIPEAGQTLAESILSPMGLRTPVAAAEALPNYLADKASDLYSGTDTANFGTSMDQARAGIEQRAEKFTPTAMVGQAGTDMAINLLTGGLGSNAVGRLAVKLTGSAAKFAPTLVKTGRAAGVLAGLATEGAVGGAEQAAATAVDQTIAKGDWENLTEKLMAEIPAGAWQGIKWGVGLGLGFKAAGKGLGLIRAKFSDAPAPELDIRIGNKGEPTPHTADVFESNLPLRSSELVDNGLPEAIQARQLATTEVADQVRVDAHADIERDLAKMLDIESTHETGLAKQAPWAFGDDVQIKNSADANLQTSKVYDPEKPLRASEIVDAGTPEQIAARQRVTPEHAKVLQTEALESVEKLENRKLEIEAELDHQLRLRQKTEYHKTFDQKWQGPSLDEILDQNGLSPASLERLAADTVGDGGQVKRILRQIEIEKRNLPNGGSAAVRPTGPVLQAPAPGQRVTSTLPNVSADPYQAVGDLGDYAKSLVKAGQKTSGPSGPTVGEMLSALDQIKRTAQKVAAKKGGLIHEALLEPTERMRKFLEDPANVGERAAQGQRVVNEQWSADIDTQRQTRDFYTEGRVKADKVNGDPYEALDVVDRGKVKGLVSQVGTTGADEAVEEAFRARGRQRFMSLAARVRWGGQTDRNLKLLHEYAGLQHKAEGTLNKVALANRYAEQNVIKASDPGLQQLRAATPDGARINGKAVDSLLKSLGDPASDSTEEAIKVALRRQEKGLTGEALAEYRKLRTNVEQNMNRVALANKYAAEGLRNATPTAASEITAIAKGAASSLPVVKQALQSRDAFRVARDADTAGAALGIKAAAVRAQKRLDAASKLGRILDPLTDQEKTVLERGVRPAIMLDKVRDRIKELENEQDETTDQAKKLQSSVLDLADHGGDELAAAFSQRMNARRDFLLGKLPPAPEPSPLGGKVARDLDEDTLQQFALYEDAADKPLDALDRIRHGEGLPEDRETLQELYSGIWQEFQHRAIDDLSNRAEEGKTLDYDQQLAVADALGLPLMPSVSGDSISFWQGISAMGQEQAAEKAQARAAKVSGGKDVYSKADRIG